LGPASDVYGLGATLYCLLTARAPIENTDLGVALQKVERGDIPPAREIKPSVPAALEAVCRKAMAVKPEDRYANPRSLANDIEHWLADEPVSVYREAVPARLKRWVRKHKTLAVSGVALVVVAAILGISGRYLTGAREYAAEQTKIAGDMQG